MKVYAKLEILPLGVAMESCVLAASGDDVINEKSIVTIDKQSGGEAITFDNWDNN